MSCYHHVLDLEAASEVGTDRCRSAGAGGHRLHRQLHLRHQMAVAAATEGEPKVVEVGGAARVAHLRTVHVVGEVLAEAVCAAGDRPAPVRGHRARVQAPAAMAVAAAAEGIERGRRFVARVGVVGQALVGQAAVTEVVIAVGAVGQEVKKMCEKNLRDFSKIKRAGVFSACHLSLSLLYHNSCPRQQHSIGVIQLYFVQVLWSPSEEQASCGEGWLLACMFQKGVSVCQIVLQSERKTLKGGIELFHPSAIYSVM